MTQASIASNQEERLRKRAEETGKYGDLLFFLGARRAFSALAALAPAVDVPEERITLALLRGEDARALVEETPAGADPWIYFSLAKALLAQERFDESLGLVEKSLQAGQSDVSVINLLLKYAAQRGALEIARHMAEISLQLAPEQREVAGMLEQLEQGVALSYAVPLSPLPERFSVGVYVPAYQAADFLPEVIESLLGQCYPLDAILIVDDGSTDGTATVAQAYPVTYVRHEVNRGLAAARNTGFGTLQSDLVGAIDADVCLDPGYIKYILMEYELAGPEYAGVGGSLRERHQSNPADHWRQRHLSQDAGVGRIAPARFLFGSNTVHRRAAVLEVGGFDERFRSNSEDGYISRALQEAGYHLAYTPNARAEHLRRDTAPSVLRTFWNWAAETRVQKGVFASLEHVFVEMRNILHRAAGLMRLDLEDGLGDLLYVDFLYIFYENFQNLRHAAGSGLIDIAGARGVQDVLLRKLAALEHESGGTLYNKAFEDLRALLLEAEGDMACLPSACAEHLNGMLTDLECFLANTPVEQYRLLVE